MMSLHFTDQPVVDFRTAALGNNEDFKAYFHGMLNRGYIFLLVLLKAILNDALSEKDIDFTLSAFEDWLKNK